MKIYTLEEFIEIYLNSASSAIQNDRLSSLDDFYSYLFPEVSEKTGFSERDLIYIHHAFHWSLFLKNYSPLHFLPSKFNGTGYKIAFKQKNTHLEIPQLSEHIIRENRILLQQKLDKIQDSQD